MINAAIIGVGRWGQALVSAVQGKSDAIRFVAAVTRSPDTCAAFLQNAALPVVGFEQALADPAIDAVVLATPHALHAGQIIQAARADKHVFVEKPFTLTHASAVEALGECRRANITLGVGLNRRFFPAFVAMKRRIDAGEFGQLMHVEGVFASNIVGEVGTWRRFASESPAGSMTSLGIHALDLMIALAAEVTEVTALSHKRAIAWDIDDTTAVLLRHRSGVSGTLTTLGQGAHLFMVRAFGAKGWIELRGERTLHTSIAPDKGMGGTEHTEQFEPFDSLRAELDAFAAAVQAGRPALLPDEQIVNGIAVLEAIAAAAQQPHLAVRIG